MMQRKFCDLENRAAREMLNTYGKKTGNDFSYIQIMASDEINEDRINLFNQKVRLALNKFFL